MTSAAEPSSWSEYNNAPVVSLPNMVSSSDLFDGELFGDELMDIYNSAVEATAQNPGKYYYPRQRPMARASGRPTIHDVSVLLTIGTSLDTSLQTWPAF
jgi:hypothetical protein